MFSWLQYLLLPHAKFYFESIFSPSIICRTEFSCSSDLSSLSPWKQERNLPCERCFPVLGGQKTSLSTEVENWGLELLLLLFSRSIMSNSWRPQGQQPTRPPCPSLIPRVYSNLCPLSWWCHPTISSSVIPFSPAFNLSLYRVFSNKSVLCIKWPKYWSFSFSISTSSEYSGLISFG